MDKREFVCSLIDAFPAFSPLSAESRLFVIAQAALESGWGNTPQSAVHNVLNVTAGSQEHGRAHSWPEPRPVLIGADTEPDGHGGWVTIHQYWRAYDSIESAIADYMRLLEWPRYQPARDALLAGRGEAFIDYLGPDRLHLDPPIGGYFTMPSRAYLNGWTDAKGRRHEGWRTHLAEVTAIVNADESREAKRFV